MLPGLAHNRSTGPLRGSRCRHEVGFAHDTRYRPCRCLDPVEWLVVRSGGQKAQDLVDPGILKKAFPWPHKLADPKSVGHGVCSSSLSAALLDGPPDAETTVSLGLAFQRMPN